MNSVFRRDLGLPFPWHLGPGYWSRLIMVVTSGVDQIWWGIGDAAGAVSCHDPVVVIDVPQVQDMPQLVAESPLSSATTAPGWRSWPVRRLPASAAQRCPQQQPSLPMVPPNSAPVLRGSSGAKKWNSCGNDDFAVISGKSVAQRYFPPGVPIAPMNLAKR